MLKNCNSKFTCLNCKGKHHVAICDKGVEEKKYVNSSTNTLVGVEVNLAETPPETPQTNCCFIADENNVLLQTARACVTSTDEYRKANLQIFIKKRNIIQRRVVL